MYIKKKKIEIILVQALTNETVFEFPKKFKKYLFRKTIINTWNVGWKVAFDSVLTLVGYLMPNIVYTYIIYNV